MHELEDDCLRGRLSLVSGLINLEAPKVFPLKLGEGTHHDGRKREIEQTSELNNTRAKTISLELFNSADGNIRHLLNKIEKVRINTILRQVTRHGITCITLEIKTHKSWH